MVVLVLLVGWLFLLWFLVSWEDGVEVAFIRVSGKTVSYAVYEDNVKCVWREVMRREFLDESK